MRFIDREAELTELRKLERLSKNKLFVVVLYGLRRVGKTRLLTEFIGEKGIYFFVNKNKASGELLKEFEEILRKRTILGELEHITSWDEFFEILVKRVKVPSVFDEFQNFYSVEPSVFGTLQKSIDLNEEQQGLIILSGSLTGLMKNTFQGSKEPLYGRIKTTIKLEPLSLKSCLGLQKDLALTKEELVKLYAVFGGYPKYYVAIEDFGLQGKSAEEIVDALFLTKNAPLEDEVNIILSQEFGARSGTYYSILEAIANGNNTSSSIAGYLNTPATSITRQINELKDYFELIEFEMPYAGKRGEHKLKSQLMQFWFSAIHKHVSDYAARNPQFIADLKSNLNDFFSRGFERSAKEFLEEKLILTTARRQWGKIAGAQKGKNTYEIDLMGQNAKKNIYAFEFKWKEIKNPPVELDVLKKKLDYIHPQLKEITVGLVAKKIREKEKYKQEGQLLYDLEDF